MFTNDNAIKYIIKILVTLIIVFSLYLIYCYPVYAITLYVATNGSDKWSGKLVQPNETHTDGPLASIMEARNRIRKLKESNKLKEPIDVIVHDGIYRLHQTIIFEPQDSGNEQFPITYKAFPGSRPVISGAIPVSGFKPYKDGLWHCVITDFQNTYGRFEQLFANGVRLTRARSPNTSYYYMRSSELIQAQERSVGEKFKNRDTIYANPGDTEHLRNLSHNELQDIVVTVYHSWEVSKHKILVIDQTNNKIILNGQTRWPIQWLGIKQRYILENYRSALDSPGEWFLNKEGILYYYPKINENIRNFVAEAPSGMETLVMFKGQPEDDKFVKYITFKGLTFCYSESRLPEKGNSDMQAAVGVSATIIADGAQHINFQDCEISHTGNYGLWFRRSCSECKVVHCYIHDLGAGGIKIGEPGIRKDKNQLTEKITIENCIIRGGGRVYPGAVAIWIGQSMNNCVAHNEISDFFYSGVSAGWRWGYGKSLATNNIIEYNHIHHLGQKVLSDLGGIYTLGESPGTIIRHNTIHDIFSYDLYGKGAWGIYNDQGSSYIIVENNLVYNTKTGGYHLNGGKENIIRNNIFAFGEDSQLQNSGVEPNLSFSFYNNIVMWKSGSLFAGKWKNANVRLFNNIYWDFLKRSIRFEGASLEEWQKMGRDTGSAILDPNFTDASKFDFRLNESSPVFKIGFKSFDYQQAGVYGDIEWLNLASQLNLLPTQLQKR